jgi:hypothetical protein
MAYGMLNAGMLVCARLLFFVFLDFARFSRICSYAVVCSHVLVFSYARYARLLVFLVFSRFRVFAFLRMAYARMPVQ